MIDKQDLPILGSFAILAIGGIVLLIVGAVALGFAAHMFVWAYSGAW